MKKLLQIGAGNIGRGFIARLFYNNDYAIHFADVDAKTIDMLKAEKKYTVEIVQDTIETETINVTEAINSMDQAAFNRVFNDCDIITTAVGASILKFVAQNIAEALKCKFEAKDTKKITIIACENYIKASSFLKELVLEKLPEDVATFTQEVVIFADAAVDCIVPPSENKESLTVRVEAFYELVVDKTALIDSDLLAIPNIIFTDTILAFVERKLFTLNAAHATTAYLGYIMGYKAIDEAIADKNIRGFIQDMMTKNGEILCRKHNFDAAEHTKYIQKILKRFDNTYLHDDVQRVGRELLRKISNNERLISPIKDALVANIECEILYVVVAIALSYKNEAEIDTIVVQRLLDARGKAETIAFLTGLDNQHAINTIKNAYEKIESEGIKWVFQY